MCVYYRDLLVGDWRLYPSAFARYPLLFSYHLRLNVNSRYHRFFSKAWYFLNFLTIAFFKVIVTIQLCGTGVCRQSSPPSNTLVVGQQNLFFVVFYCKQGVRVAASLFRSRSIQILTMLSPQCPEGGPSFFDPLNPWSPAVAGYLVIDFRWYP